MGTTYYPNRRGIDFYHTYKQDLALLAEMGMKIFRTSICRARLFPNGDEAQPNPEGIRYYKDLFGECKMHGMKVFATILHYDIPVQLVLKYGAWKNRKTIDFYCRYVEVLFRELGDLVDYWLPFNEINAGRFSPWDGVCLIPDQEPHMDQEIFQCLHHQFLASARVVKMGHEMLPGSKIGCMIARFTTYPATCRLEDNMQAVLDDQYSNWFYTDIMARGKYPAYMNRYFDKLGIDMHQSTSPIQISNIATLGYDYLLPVSFCHNMAESSAAFGAALRMKDKELRSAALTTSFSAFLGISEPALFTVQVSNKTPLIAAMIANGIGGALTVVLGAKCYAFVMPGITSLPTYANGGAFNLLMMVVCIASTFVIAAILSFILGGKLANKH